MDSQESPQKSAPEGITGQGKRESDAQTVAEKLAELLEEMGAQREQMLKILEFCAEERTAEEVDEALAPLRAWRQSVYSPVTMRSLLLKAGALEYRDNDEAPEEQADEMGNLVLPPQAQATWLATPEALAYCETLDPFADLVHALDAIASRNVYLAVLKLCAEEPRSVGGIAEFVHQTAPEEADSLDAGGMVGRLEEAGALEWRGAWVTSNLGNDYLKLNA